MGNILPINQTRFSQGHKIFIVLFVCFFFFFIHTVHLQFFKKSYTRILGGNTGTEPDSKRKGIKKQRVCSVGQESITVLLYLLFLK
jgi:hypothetical protein